MTDVQLLTIVVTLVAILGAMYANRKSVEDMRDVLKAEAKAQGSEIREGVNQQFAGVIHTLQRIENKLDHVVEVQATHGERLQRLEKH